MKPVFLVYTFQDAEHLGELVNALGPHRVFVHVDAKVDVGDFEAALERTGNAVLLDDRVQVNWGGYSQVRAIRALVLLSGSDYPLRAVDELLEHLRSHPGRQYLRAFEISSSEQKYRRQVDRRHHRDLSFLSKRTGNRMLRKVRNGVIKVLDGPLSLRHAPVPPTGMKIGHGGTHFAVTAACMRAMEAIVTPEVERYFEAVFCPEEKFYHSLVMRTRFSTATPAGGFEPYVGSGNWRYANLHLIDPTLVRVFTIDDWPEIVASPRFFIRKIVSGPSTSLRTKLNVERLRPAPLK